MPSWTEVCEAAYGRSQQALSDTTVTCSGIVVSWKRIESTMMRFVLCSAWWHAIGLSRSGAAYETIH